LKTDLLPDPSPIVDALSRASALERVNFTMKSNEFRALLNEIKQLILSSLKQERAIPVNQYKPRDEQFFLDFKKKLRLRELKNEQEKLTNLITHFEQSTSIDEQEIDTCRQCH